MVLSGLHFRRVASDRQARGVGQGEGVGVAVRGGCSAQWARKLNRGGGAGRRDRRLRVSLDETDWGMRPKCSGSKVWPEIRTNVYCFRFCLFFFKNSIFGGSNNRLQILF